MKRDRTTLRIEEPPGDVLLALGEVIPWGLVALAGMSAGLVVLAAGNALPLGPRSPRSRPAAQSLRG